MTGGTGRFSKQNHFGEHWQLKLAWSQWNIERDGLLLNPEKNMELDSDPRPRRQARGGKSSGLSILLNPDLDEYHCTSSDSYGFLLAKTLPIDAPQVAEYGIAIRPSSEVFMGIRPEVGLDRNFKKLSAFHVFMFFVQVTVAHQNIRSLNVKERNCYFHGEFQLAYFKYYTASNCYDECVANETYRVCGCVNFYMSCKITF